MKYFLDTEFIETGNKHPIVPLSIGIVSEDGREYYGVFNASAKDLSLADDWVKENVLKYIDFSKAKSNSQIKRDILRMVANDGNIEFWGYYADYDWVLFCGLFGKMIDLPIGFPKFCMDIKQLTMEMGNPELPIRADRIEHCALSDAREMRFRYNWLMELKEHGKSL